MEDEVETQEEGLQQEQQPRNPYTTYDDMKALGDTIEYMNTITQELLDKSKNLLSHFAYWSSQWNLEDSPPPQ